MSNLRSQRGKLIVLSAPSGTGKTAIKNDLLRQDPTLVFSVSATTRPKREDERNGKDYYFISEEEFKAHIENNDFIEYDHHFNNYYGTLKLSADPELRLGSNVILDIDVVGAINVKKKYGDQAVLIFIKPPSMEELRKRLESRGTETEESLRIRMARVKKEMAYADQFDYIVVNDTVQRAAAEILEIMRR